jgi:hypothetical protein
MRNLLIRPPHALDASQAETAVLSGNPLSSGDRDWLLMFQCETVMGFWPLLFSCRSHRRDRWSIDWRRCRHLDGAIMAKIFYCGGSSGRMGTLRAVLPLVEFVHILSEESPTYVGHSFPEMKESALPCALIEVAGDEELEQWRAGFYRVEKRPLDFEVSLRALGKAPNGTV